MSFRQLTLDPNNFTITSENENSNLVSENKMSSYHA